MPEEKDNPRGWVQKLKVRARAIKRDAAALWYAYGHPDTPLSAKLLIGLTLGYLMSPIDLIPDFIPVLGLLDDVILVPLMIIASIKLIPAEVWKASQARAATEPLRLKNNRLAGAIIIGIWVLMAGYLLWRWLAPAKP